MSGSSPLDSGAPTLKENAIDAELIGLVYTAGGEREYFVGNDGLKHVQWTFMPDELVKFVALIREVNK